MKIVVIGGGNMGFTYAQGIKSKLDLTNGSIVILEKSEERALFLKNNGFDVTDNLNTIKDAAVIMFAVKPQSSEALFKEIKNLINTDQIFISIMAGVLADTIKEQLNIKT